MSERSRTEFGLDRIVVAAPTEIVKTVRPAPREIWSEVFRKDPFALECQSPEWADAMRAAHGFGDASTQYETSDGRTLIVPMLRRRAGGLIRMDSANPPACGIGGVLADGGVRREETVAVLGDLAARRTPSITLSPGPFQADVWRGGDHHGAREHTHRVHLLDLNGGWDEVWARRFNKTSRRGVRFAERNGVTVETGTGGELVAEFYELLEGAVDRWSRMQHEPTWLARRRMHARDPLTKFEALGRCLGDRFQVWLARVDGELAAASLLALGANAHEFRAAMDYDLRTFKATDLLQANMIKAACAAGCRYYYLGESGTGPLGTYKERFGARPVVFSEYRFERLPLERMQRGAKTVVKRAIGFKD